MKNLKQLQNEFADYLRGNANSGIDDDIISDEKASSKERLGFYHDAYRLRLIEVLSHDYPGISKLLGEEAFGTMALAYIRSFPSRYRSIRWFGLHLPEFLQNPKGEFEPDDKLLEMSRFEKAQNDVFDAVQTELASVEDLAAIDPLQWNSIRVEFIPAAKRLDLKYNVPQIWLELNEFGDNIPDSYKPQWQVDEFPQGWLIWRAELDSKWRALEVDEAWAIDQLKGGRTFGDICEGLSEWLDEAHIPLRAVTILKTLIVDKLIEKIDA